MNWEVRQDATELVIFDSERNVIADIYTDDNDARLMAAAPELLSALEALVEQFEKVEPLYSSDQRKIDEAKEVIAKVKGKK